MKPSHPYDAIRNLSHACEAWPSGAAMADTPSNQLAEEILLHQVFTPFFEGYLLAEDMVGRLKATKEEIDTVLRGFVDGGFLSPPQKLRGFEGDAYKPTAQGWQERERLLRVKGLRHPAIVHQCDHSLDDLIVAVIMATHIENRRPKGAGYLAANTAKTAKDLSVFLGEYSVNDISEHCKRLTESRLLRQLGNASEGNLPGFDIWFAGRTAYDSEISGRLKLAAEDSILDLIPRKHIVIFNAWQSEYNPSRTKINEALEWVVDRFNKGSNIWYPLKVVQATEPGEGALRIDVALQEKIMKADFFVGDMTPVYAYKGRLRVNENVLVEVGFALASKPSSQVILLSRVRSDVPGDPKHAKPAFDIAHVRTLCFETSTEARDKLQTELQAALRDRGWL